MDAPALLALFDELLEADAAAREVRLAQLEREHPDAARTLRAWLAADSSDDARLEPARYAGLAAAVTADTMVAGSRVGPYRLVRELGRGGMGSVWLAERAEGGFAQTVALKLIRSDLTSPEAEPRFRRERRILASLRHPNIAQLIDGGVTAEGRLWLAMEYIEGLSLRELIARSGPLPAERLVALAAQLASALAHAHAAGVVHRDLKPDNVLVAREGFAKVLDFGVAKLLREEGDHATGSSTRPGHVIGTTPYMSPEQASGEPVDFRSDQFAFGALLYEAATGNAAFARPTPSQTVAAVLRDPPPALDALAAKLPPGLVRVLRRCLEKDPERRYGATSDLARDLADVERGDTTAERRAARGSAWPRVLAAAALALALAGAWWLGRGSAPAVDAAHALRRVSAEIPIEPAERLWPGAFAMHAFALSPDGRRLVYSGLREGQRMLYARALDAREAVVLPGSDGGANPVFSPDGEWIAFFANQKLKKIPFGGGTATELAEAPNALGGIDWPEAGRIIYSPNPGVGIAEVSADGGEPVVLTEPDVNAGEGSHVWPHEVRGTRMLLYVAEVEQADSFDAGRIFALNRDNGARHLLVAGGTDPRVVGDTLYYARAGTVYAVRFDRATAQLRGSPRPLLEGVLYAVSTGAAQFDAADGVSLHARGTHAESHHELVVADRAGKIESLGLEPAGYDRARISPDGKRVILQISGADDDLWSLDLARRTLTRVTDRDENLHPTWTPDGRHVVYSHHGTPVPPPPTLYRRAADGSGQPEMLLAAQDGVRARLYSDVSPDGRTVVFGQYSLEHNFDLWLLDLETREARVWLSTPFSDIAPRFSPDGRWIAYASYPSLEGAGEVYIQSLDGERRWQVTNATGGQPVWNRNGREIFFMRSGTLYSVALGEGDDLAPAVPRELFKGDFSRYDVFPDGEHFLLMRRVEQPGLARPLQLQIGRLPAS